jgi:hypothetical protein
MPTQHYTGTLNRSNDANKDIMWHIGNTKGGGMKYVTVDAEATRLSR